MLVALTVITIPGMLPAQNVQQLFAPPEPDASRGTRVHTFTITEKFGVNHPEQIIDFDFPGAASLDPNNTCMVGPYGEKVPFQVLSGAKIAVKTDLPANAALSWQLETGCRPGASGSNLIKFSQTSDYYEITNGDTG